MRKGDQLQRMREMGLPTPPFVRLTYEDHQKGGWASVDLDFPLAVRSSFGGEDSESGSHAGAFRTCLHVKPEHLSAAIDEVFTSYPVAEQQEVVLQEMVDLDFGGVLFAYPSSVWKVEWVAGHPEALVSGRVTPKTLLLPRFTSADAFFSRWLDFWRGGGGLDQALRRGLLRLAVYAGRLLEELDPRHGLDIEFGIGNGRLYLLQARPVTTPGEAEEVLTTANHAEILPPKPSPLMTDLIARSGTRLYDYYYSLDKTLPVRAFIEEAAGMPWINLSALMDTMVHWGLPTGLVSRSVGAQDFYRVGFRPWRSLSRAGVFFRLLGRQMRSQARARKWLRYTANRLEGRQRERRERWQTRTDAAVEAWVADFLEVYIGLVGRMQDLTGAMAGPVQLLDRLGLLPRLSRAASHSASTHLLDAFRAFRQGALSRGDFLEQFGHRGMYESDIGQPRFHELPPGEWARWMESGPKAGTQPAEGQLNRVFRFLLAPVIRLIHRREWLRHESMRLFDHLRQEMQWATARHVGPSVPWWAYRTDDLIALFSGESPGTASPPTYPEPSGWDMRSFLADRFGRRRPLPDTEGEPSPAIGIYPGRVRGRVWRVEQADGSQEVKPPPSPRILVADALDPGWIPYFALVDGVISYTGGLLSHASIILRESGIPAITQAPASLALRTGDLIEMDGGSGDIVRLSEPEKGTA